MKSIYAYIPGLTQSYSETKADLQDSLKEGLNQTMSKLNKIKTNLLYSIKHSSLPMQRKPIEIREDGSKAALLGKLYDFSTFFRLEFVFRNTFWFTYRRGIGSEIETDNGWGCMIRTVQMVVAEAIKRDLCLDNISEHEQQHVIRHFSEQNEGLLSLSAVCK